MRANGQDADPVCVTRTPWKGHLRNATYQWTSGRTRPTIDLLGVRPLTRLWNHLNMIEEAGRWEREQHGRPEQNTHSILSLAATVAACMPPNSASDPISTHTYAGMDFVEYDGRSYMYKWGMQEMGQEVQWIMVWLLQYKFTRVANEQHGVKEVLFVRFRSNKSSTQPRELKLQKHESV